MTARQFEIVVDEPESAGGRDEGPTPTELLLASLASCFALALAHVAGKRDVPLGPFSVWAEGVYDGPSFREFRLEVRMAAIPDGMKGLVERARRLCYVSNTLARSPAIAVSLTPAVT